MLQHLHIIKKNLFSYSVNIYNNSLFKICLCLLRNIIKHFYFKILDTIGDDLDLQECFNYIVNSIRASTQVKLISFQTGCNKNN